MAFKPNNPICILLKKEALSTREGENYTFKYDFYDYSEITFDSKVVKQQLVTPGFHQLVGMCCLVHLGRKPW